MCGIAGIVRFRNSAEPPSLSLLEAMISAVRHRGPDEFGVYRDPQAGLVHARLSIIDLRSGQQPLSNEDSTLWITFNGEIFNYVELRSELENLGHRFRTTSDTEVIVHAYEAWGNGCFPRFNGQWSVALWDSAKHRLVLSRDRVGVRPLYLSEAGGVVRFASEVKSIFADPGFARALDPAGINQTFTYWTTIAPRTPFTGIEELPAGHVRTYEADGSRTDVCYWTPTYPDGLRDVQAPYPLSETEAAEALLEKLTAATRLRTLRADVPVGSYLSGGLDSSLIARLGRQAASGPFSTFSLRFEDAEFDETRYQTAMARTMDSTHHEVRVSRNTIAAVFPDVIRHTERPILRTAPAPLFVLSQLVRENGMKAVLTGEGADEMLAGYDLFREAKIREFWSHAPSSPWRPRLFDRLYPYLARSPQMTKGMALEFWKRGLEHAEGPEFSHTPRWSTTSALKRFLTPAWKGPAETNPYADVLSRLPASFSRWDSLSRAQYIEIVTLLSGYLMSSQGDRMLMAHSVEGRFPFLDVNVMEFCNDLPAGYKLRCLDEKHVLKRAAKGLVPDEIIQRPKQPYRAPDAVSFFGPGKPEYVAELLSDVSLRKSGIFQPSAVALLVAKCVASAARGTGGTPLSNSDNMAIVGILSTQLLHHHFIESGGEGRSRPVQWTTQIDRTVPESRSETHGTQHRRN